MKKLEFWQAEDYLRVKRKNKVKESNNRNSVRLVIGAAGTHPAPSRTRQLSPPAPMVLEGQPSGRVGHRQTNSVLLVPESTPPSNPAGAFGVTRLGRLGRRFESAQVRKRPEASGFLLDWNTRAGLA